MVLGQMVEALDPSSDDQARMLKGQWSEVNGHAGPVLNLLLVGSTWSQFSMCGCKVHGSKSHWDQSVPHGLV